MLHGATKDGQVVDKEWRKLAPTLDGVHVREVRHVPRDHGIITEVFRPEWDPTGLPVVQVYQSRLFPGAIGAWSCHMRTTDRLFVNQGQLKMVLFDGREESRTHGQIMELHLGDPRPGLVVIPPGVWHGLQNVGTSDALVLNCPTLAYDYEDPDHYRLPYDTPQIPHTWVVRGDLRLRSDAKAGG
jgi:dTDP-4-dehydrorhamnose 3,5-epimerase